MLTKFGVKALGGHSHSLHLLSLQENVSCLNTSLVILMLARRKAKLPFYLNALREKEYAEKYPGCLLNNFHNLLRFWQRHYLNKDKDSTCLENVSDLSVQQAALVRLCCRDRLDLRRSCLGSQSDIVL